ncbi:MAG: hypothetical protein WKG07_28345 [Hymenobacter sp.]
MVLVREQRHDISYVELISNTLEAATDKAAIERYRALNAADESGVSWDENYVSNIFLARFCNIKFNDLSLGRAEKYPEHDPRMLTYSGNYILAELPQPALDALNLTSVDKMAPQRGLGGRLPLLPDRWPPLGAWLVPDRAFCGHGHGHVWLVVPLGAGRGATADLPGVR